MLPAGRRATRTDDGISLVELILAVALLGTAAVTLLGAFGTLVKSSDISKKDGDLTTTLASAAEFVVNDVAVPYTRCDANPAGAYAARLSADPPAGLVKPATIAPVQVLSVETWNGATGSFGPCATAADDAPAVARMQRVTLKLVTTDGRFERTITVVKVEPR